MRRTRPTPAARLIWLRRLADGWTVRTYIPPGLPIPDGFVEADEPWVA